MPPAGAIARWALAASMLCVSTITPAAAQEKLRVGKAVPFAWTFTPIDVGVETGIFKKHGLTLEVTGFGGEARLQQAMAADGIDIGLASGPGMAFTTKGAPVKAVAAMAGLPKNICIAVSHGSPIKSIAELKGKLIGVTTIGSLTEWLGRRMSVLQGWGPTGVRIAAVGGMDTSRAALRRGDIDALVVALEAGYASEEKQEMRVLGSTAAYVDDFITHVIFARHSMIEGKPKVVEAFVKAWFETIGFMRANKERTVAITAPVLNYPTTVISRVYDEQIGMFSTTGAFEPKALAVLKQSFIDMGLLKETPDDKVMFTTQFLPK